MIINNGDPVDLPEEFQRLVDRTPRAQRDAACRILMGLHVRGVSSYQQLADVLSSSPEEGLLGAAIGALSYFDKRKTIPLLLQLLRSPDPAVRSHALIGLEMIGGVRSVRALVRHLHHDPDPTARERAAHGLAFLPDSRCDDLAFEPLLAALRNQAEHPAVRAQAAEGLGNILVFGDRRTRRYKQAQAALIDGLDHPAPDIRFWAAFAFGTMRSRAALPRLRQLAASDTAICPGWWPVKDEASDAIECILTGDWPDHERSLQRRPA